MIRSYLAKLALMLGGIFLAFLILEFALRLLAPQIFAVHPSGLYTADPDIGYVLTPDFSGALVRSEFEVTVTTNADGLRGAPLQPRLPNTTRIMLLGDSQTWGFGVADDHTYAVHLEQSLQARFPNRDIQVLNAGVPGYGTADQLHLLASRAATWQPDLVIVQFLSVNDLKENLTPASTWATIVDGMLAQREPKSTAVDNIPTWERFRQYAKQHSHLARLLFDILGYWMTRSEVLGSADALWGEDFTTEQGQLGIDLLVQLAETAQEVDARVIFLYTTGQAQVLADTYVQPSSATIVETAAAAANVPWVDAAAYLQQHPDRRKLYYPQNGHWTSAGHAAIAELLTDVIMQNDLLEAVTSE